MRAVIRHAIVIERCFHGPPQSARGGYTCGPLARELQRAVQVSPCSAPPFERRLAIERDDDERLLLLRVGETILAEAQSTTPELEPPTARRARRRARRELVLPRLRAPSIPDTRSKRSKPW
jgi:hypothetical protein